MKKELNVLFKFIFIYLSISIYIYLYISIYISIYIERKKKGRAGVLFKRTQHSAFFCKRTLHSLRSFTFFAKERCVLCVLLRSLQKNVVFFAFFYVLKKRFLRKELKRMHRPFEFHKSPKTQKKNAKERCVL